MQISKKYLTHFASVAGKSWRATTVEIIDQVDASSIVQTSVIGTVIYICRRQSKVLKILSSCTLDLSKSQNKTRKCLLTSSSKVPWRNLSINYMEIVCCRLPSMTLGYNLSGKVQRQTYSPISFFLVFFSIQLLKRNSGQQPMKILTIIITN